MAFFPDKPSKTDEENRTWARKLIDVLAPRYGTVSPGPSTTENWARTFTKLREEHGRELVDMVLTWFLEHCEDEFVPKIKSALDFQKKFLSLSQARDRDCDCVEVSEEARKIVQSVEKAGLVFPPQIRVALPAIVQRTEENWTVFWKKMKAACRVSTDPRDLRFLVHIVSDHEATLPVEWILFLSERYGSFPSYTGSVMNLAFYPASQLFRDHFWRVWAQEWCEDGNAFDDLLDTLIKGKS